MGLPLREVALHGDIVAPPILLLLLLNRCLRAVLDRTVFRPLLTTFLFFLVDRFLPAPLIIHSMKKTILLDHLLSNSAHISTHHTSLNP